MKRQDLRIRDPFIVTDGGKYYLFGTGERTRLYVYESDDMENWQKGGLAFEIDENSWAEVDTWAAEVHKYGGKFYMFVSLMGKHGKRGTQVAVCDTPNGKYLPVVNAPITPMEKSCIDATLFEYQGEPYVLWSHDWPDCYDGEKKVYVGEIWAAQAARDLSKLVGEPFKLFSSTDSPISKARPHAFYCRELGKDVVRYGSDAPFLQRLKCGALYLTWSPYLQDNYVVLGVRSQSGDIRGPWTHEKTPLYQNNGGHAMFFDDFDGKRKMCIHQPEHTPFERAKVLEFVEDADGNVCVKNEK